LAHVACVWSGGGGNTNTNNNKNNQQEVFILVFKDVMKCLSNLPL
jgi:hypothetical protein